MRSNATIRGLIAALLTTSVRAEDAAPVVDFAREVQPIFAKHCVGCHGAKTAEAGLRLDDKRRAMKGSDNGPVIVARASDKSRMIALIEGTNPEEVMPPEGDRLSAAEVATLRRWIDAGAPWPDQPSTQGTVDHWSLRPLRRPTLPQVKDTSWSRGPLDRFILAKLESEELSPSASANHEVLSRRLYFDLIGLPPTPEQLDAFVQDRSPGAYEKLVDRLLASPHYGERWARHWLDVARFTESQGFERDKLRDNAWHYRDYVVNSLNADKPYARFVTEQLAGDALTPFDPDAMIATSFLVCGSWDEVGNNQQSQVMKERVREEELEDLLSVVGQTFLGLTVNCARCHSHKFDPVPQEDYYRLKSVFEGIYHGERPLAPPQVIAAWTTRDKTLRERVDSAQKKLAEFDEAKRLRLLANRQSITPAGGPRPISHWTFDQDSRDAIGSMHGKLAGKATIRGGRLQLDGKGAHLHTGPIGKTVREKTLAAWIKLSTLEQGGGAAVSLEEPDGSVFDAIVFGERASRVWIAGSDFHRRSADPDVSPETAAEVLLHLAVVYGPENGIQVYRNGEPYGATHVPASGLQRFSADARILIGKRHTGGGRAHLAGEVEEASLFDRALSADEVRKLVADGPAAVSESELLASLTTEERTARTALVDSLDSAKHAHESVPPIPVSYTGLRTQPKPTHRLLRGDVTQPAEVVTPGALSAVAGLPADFGLSADAPEAERRLRLARWITDERNPLTARVIVNRIWHYHFGQGLVPTTNDFGRMGVAPSHPELLDWLACDFLERGGSIKELHRAIVCSATYRQASASRPDSAARDADNRLLWRFAPRRLEGEAIRDSILAVSGQLNPRMGGPGYRPFRIVIDNSHFYLLEDKTGPEYQRRTLYRAQVNSGKDPLLEVLDCPDPAVKTPARATTTTPLQALALMNNSFVQVQSKVFAEQLLRDAKGDVDQAVELAYQRAFGRSAAAAERQRGIRLARASGLDTFCWAIFNASEFLYVQ